MDRMSYLETLVEREDARRKGSLDTDRSRPLREATRETQKEIREAFKSPNKIQSRLKPTQNV